MYQCKVFYHIEVLMHGTKSLFYCTCTVTHYSISICSGIEIHVSGCLPEVKDKRSIQITSFESGCSHLRELLTHGDSTVYLFSPFCFQIWVQMLNYFGPLELAFVIVFSQLHLMEVQ